MEFREKISLHFSNQLRISNYYLFTQYIPTAALIIKFLFQKEIIADISPNYLFIIRIIIFERYPIFITRNIHRNSSRWKKKKKREGERGKKRKITNRYHRTEPNRTDRTSSPLIGHNRARITFQFHPCTRFITHSI